MLGVSRYELGVAIILAFLILVGGGAAYSIINFQVRETPTSSTVPVEFDLYAWVDVDADGAPDPGTVTGVVTHRLYHPDGTRTTGTALQFTGAAGSLGTVSVSAPAGGFHAWFTVSGTFTDDQQVSTNVTSAFDLAIHSSACELDGAGSEWSCQRHIVELRPREAVLWAYGQLNCSLARKGDAVDVQVTFRNPSVWDYDPTSMTTTPQYTVQLSDGSNLGPFDLPPIDQGESVERVISHVTTAAVDLEVDGITYSNPGVVEVHSGGTGAACIVYDAAWSQSEDGVVSSSEDLAGSRVLVGGDFELRGVVIEDGELIINPTATANEGSAEAGEITVTGQAKLKDLVVRFLGDGGFDIAASARLDCSNCDIRGGGLPPATTALSELAPGASTIVAAGDLSMTGSLVVAGASHALFLGPDAAVTLTNTHLSGFQRAAVVQDQLATGGLTASGVTTDEVPASMLGVDQTHVPGITGRSRDSALQEFILTETLTVSTVTALTDVRYRCIDSATLKINSSAVVELERGSFTGCADSTALEIDGGSLRLTRFTVEAEAGQGVAAPPVVNISSQGSLTLDRATVSSGGERTVVSLEPGASMSGIEEATIRGSARPLLLPAAACGPTSAATTLAGDLRVEVLPGSYAGSAAALSVAADCALDQTGVLGIHDSSRAVRAGAGARLSLGRLTAHGAGSGLLIGAGVAAAVVELECIRCGEAVRQSGGELTLERLVARRSDTAVVMHGGNLTIAEADLQDARLGIACAAGTASASATIADLDGRVREAHVVSDSGCAISVPHRSLAWTRIAARGTGVVYGTEVILTHQDSRFNPAPRLRWGIDGVPVISDPLAPGDCARERTVNVWKANVTGVTQWTGPTGPGLWAGAVASGVLVPTRDGDDWASALRVEDLVTHVAGIGSSLTLIADCDVAVPVLATSDPRTGGQEVDVSVGGGPAMSTRLGAVQHHVGSALAAEGRSGSTSSTIEITRREWTWSTSDHVLITETDTLPAGLDDPVNIWQCQPMQYEDAIFSETWLANSLPVFPESIKLNHIEAPRVGSRTMHWEELTMGPGRDAFTLIAGLGEPAAWRLSSQSGLRWKLTSRSASDVEAAIHSDLPRFRSDLLTAIDSGTWEWVGTGAVDKWTLTLGLTPTLALIFVVEEPSSWDVGSLESWAPHSMITPGVWLITDWLVDTWYVRDPAQNWFRETSAPTPFSVSDFTETLLEWRFAPTIVDGAALDWTWKSSVDSDVEFEFALSEPRTGGPPSTGLETSPALDWTWKSSVDSDVEFEFALSEPRMGGPPSTGLETSPASDFGVPCTFAAPDTYTPLEEVDLAILPALPPTPGRVLPVGWTVQLELIVDGSVVPPVMNTRGQGGFTDLATAHNLLSCPTHLEPVDIEVGGQYSCYYRLDPASWNVFGRGGPLGGTFGLLGEGPALTPERFLFHPGIVPFSPIDIKADARIDLRVPDGYDDWVTIDQFGRIDIKKTNLRLTVCSAAQDQPSQKYAFQLVFAFDDGSEFTKLIVESEAAQFPEQRRVTGDQVDTSCGIPQDDAARLIDDATEVYEVLCPGCPGIGNTLASLQEYGAGALEAALGDGHTASTPSTYAGATQTYHVDANRTLVRQVEGPFPEVPSPLAPPTKVADARCRSQGKALETSLNCVDTGVAVEPIAEQEFGLDQDPASCETAVMILERDVWCNEHYLRIPATYILDGGFHQTEPDSIGLQVTRAHPHERQEEAMSKTWVTGHAGAGIGAITQSRWIPDGTRAPNRGLVHHFDDCFVESLEMRFDISEVQQTDPDTSETATLSEVVISFPAAAIGISDDIKDSHRTTRSMDGASGEANACDGNPIFERESWYQTMVASRNSAYIAVLGSLPQPTLVVSDKRCGQASPLCTDGRRTTVGVTADSAAPAEMQLGELSSKFMIGGEISLISEGVDGLSMSSGGRVDKVSSARLVPGLSLDPGGSGGELATVEFGQRTGEDVVDTMIPLSAKASHAEFSFAAGLQATATRWMSGSGVASKIGLQMATAAEQEDPELFIMQPPGAGGILLAGVSDVSSIPELPQTGWDQSLVRRFGMFWPAVNVDFSQDESGVLSSGGLTRITKFYVEDPKEFPEANPMRMGVLDQDRTSRGATADDLQFLSFVMAKGTVKGVEKCSVRMQGYHERGNARDLRQSMDLHFDGSSPHLKETATALPTMTYGFDLDPLDIPRLAPCQDSVAEPATAPDARYPFPIPPGGGPMLVVPSQVDEVLLAAFLAGDSSEATIPNIVAFGLGVIVVGAIIWGIVTLVKILNEKADEADIELAKSHYMNVSQYRG